MARSPRTRDIQTFVADLFRRVRRLGLRLADFPRNPSGGGHSHDHGTLTNVTEDQHHDETHAHDGADGSGTVAHADTTGQTGGDHHPEPQRKSENTGTIAAGAIADVTVTWPTSFPDDQYVPVAQVAEEQAGDTLQLLKIVSIDPGSITVRVRNNAGSDLGGTVQAIGIAE